MVRNCLEPVERKSAANALRHIDYGLMICTRQFLEGSPSDVPFDLAGALETLSRNGQLAGHEVNQRFYEIGSRSGLAELSQLLSVRSTSL